MTTYIHHLLSCPMLVRHKFDVWYAAVTKDSGRTMAGMRVFVGTGKISKDRFTMTADTQCTTIPATHDAIRTRFRKVRDEELAQISALDEEIRALQAKRNALVKVAWEKGHAVTVKELTEIADANEAKRVPTN